MYLHINAVDSIMPEPSPKVPALIRFWRAIAGCAILIYSALPEAYNRPGSNRLLRSEAHVIHPWDCGNAFRRLPIPAEGSRSALYVLPVHLPSQRVDYLYRPAWEVLSQHDGGGYGERIRVCREEAGRRGSGVGSGAEYVPRGPVNSERSCNQNSALWIAGHELVTVWDNVWKYSVGRGPGVSPISRIIELGNA